MLKSIAILLTSCVVLNTAQAQINARGSDSTMHVLKALAAAYETDSGKKVNLQGGGSGAERIA